jgi:hypothetical protein
MYPVLVFDWSDTAVGVTATTCHELSPRKKVDDEGVPLALNFAIPTVPSLGVPLANGVA